MRAWCAPARVALGLVLMVSSSVVQHCQRGMSGQTSWHAYVMTTDITSQRTQRTASSQSPQHPHHRGIFYQDRASFPSAIKATVAAAAEAASAAQAVAVDNANREAAIVAAAADVSSHQHHNRTRHPAHTKRARMPRDLREDAAMPVHASKPDVGSVSYTHLTLPTICSV